MMFKIILFFITALIVALGFGWLVDNNGVVNIALPDYQISTDIVTASILLFFALVAMVIFLNIVSGLLNFKLTIPKFLKKNPLKQKDKIINKYKNALELLVEASLALNSGDLKKATKLENQINSLIDDKRVKKLLSAQIAYLQGNYKQANQLFVELNNNHAMILSLKSQLEIYLSENKIEDAIKTAQKIISFNKQDKQTILLLLSLYKKQQNWQEAKKLIEKYSLFKDNVYQQEVVFINTALAQEYYLAKQYNAAIKQSKAVLKIDKGYLKAALILIKSYIKIGAYCTASAKIRSFWKKHPDIVLYKLYNFLYRKNNPKKRLKMVKKLQKTNPNHYLSDIAVADLALTIKDFLKSKIHLQNSIDKKNTVKAHNLMMIVNKHI